MGGIPKISIILRVQNQEKLIDRALDSILKQSFSEIELICIDNCSSDHTLDILRRYEKNDDRVCLIANPKDMGLLYSDIVGLKAARGEYVTFVDGDDTIPPDACERMYKIAKESAADIIQVPFSFCVGSHADPGLLAATQAYFRPYPTPLYGEAIARKSVLERKYAWNIIGKLFSNEICKKATEGLSCPYFTFADDMIMYIFLAYFANSYIGKPDIKPCYAYSIGTGQTTSATPMSLEAFQEKCSVLKAREVLTEFYQKNHAAELYQDYCSQIPQNLMHDILYIWLNKLNPKYQKEGFAFLCANAAPDLIAGSVLDLHYIRTDLEIEIRKKDELLLQEKEALAHCKGRKEEAINRTKELEELLLQEKEALAHCEDRKEEAINRTKELEGLLLQEKEAFAHCEDEKKEAINRINVLEGLLLQEKEALAYCEKRQRAVIEHTEKIEELIENPHVMRAFKVENLISKFSRLGIWGKIKLFSLLTLHIIGIRKMKLEFPFYKEMESCMSDIKETIR